MSFFVYVFVLYFSCSLALSDRAQNTKGIEMQMNNK